MPGMTERARVREPLARARRPSSAVAVAFVLLCALAACERKPAPPTGPGREAAVAPGGTGATATIPPEDGQWTMPAKDYASTRFSGLDEINVP